MQFLCMYTQEEQISQEMSIDHRIHSRLIGAKGKAIAKVMERFSVDIRFPRDKGSDIITITGLEENVEDAKEHLLTVAEDYVSSLFIHTWCVCGYFPDVCLRSSVLPWFHPRISIVC